MRKGREESGHGIAESNQLTSGDVPLYGLRLCDHREQREKVPAMPCPSPSGGMAFCSLDRAERSFCKALGTPTSACPLSMRDPQPSEGCTTALIHRRMDCARHTLSIMKRTRGVKGIRRGEFLHAKAINNDPDQGSL